MRIILATILLSAALTSHATPIYIDFEIKQSAPSGDARPGVFTGTWSFDDSLVKPGGLFEDVYKGRKLDSFSFSWLGEHWSPANARLARLEFDEDGKVRSWIIGGRAVSGGCGSVGTLDCVGVPSKVADFYLSATRLEPGIPPPELIAVGVRAGGAEFVDAQGSFKVRGTAVPTPGSLQLLGAALLFLAIFGRVRSKTLLRSV
jgi:hypothetical protein